MLEGAANERFHQQELAYYNAYISGMLSQDYAKGKFPKYDKHAPKKRRKPSGVRRSWKALKMIVETWNATAGGFDNRKKSG